MNYTKEQHKKMSAIPNTEILKDIEDTKSELVELRLNVEYLKKRLDNVGIGTPDGRMASFKLDAAYDGIERREKFVKKLEAVLDDRKLMKAQP